MPTKLENVSINQVIKTIKHLSQLSDIRKIELIKQDDDLWTIIAYQ